MKKIYLGIGILVLLISLTSARAELIVSPETQSTCCSILQYDVTITNPFNAQRGFTLNSEVNSEDIWVSLEPKLILLPSEATETLTLFVRPTCGMDAGEYTIQVSSECGICESYVEEAEVKVVIDDCIVLEPLEPEEPEIPEEPETNQSQNDSPTGLAVSSDKDTLVLSIVALLAITLIVIVVLIKKT
jgi:hypothetical protein